MRCYPCTGCGKCELGKKVELKQGECARCGHLNEVGALECARCGVSFPLPPGKGTLHSGAAISSL